MAVSAPVFCLSGKTAGMIFSDGGWTDSKIGLLATRIIFCLETKFGQAEWEVSNHIYVSVHMVVVDESICINMTNIWVL